MEELKQELLAATRLTAYLAKRNYILAYVVTFISVFASIAAGILVALESAHIQPLYIAVIAALPAGMMTVNTVFRFEQKSAWFWKKNKHQHRLYRALVYEDADPAQISREFSQLETEMENDWVSFGAVNQKEG